MGSKFSKSSSSQQPVNDECAICLQPTAGRGGIPIMSPGCCGKFFHQPCMDQMIANGNSSCPNCRAAFPQQQPVVGNVVVAPMLPRLRPQITSRRQVSTNFMPSSMSMEEELIEELHRNVDSASDSTPQPSPQPIIAIKCSPERYLS